MKSSNKSHPKKVGFDLRVRKDESFHSTLAQGELLLLKQMANIQKKIKQKCPFSGDFC